MNDQKKNTPIIKIENLNKAYPIQNADSKQQNIRVLEALNFEVQELAKVCIQGPSGCGKSTLISILAGIEKFDSGQVQVLGQNYVAQKNNSKSASLALVFQQFHLLDYLSALENVELALHLNKSPSTSEIKDQDIVDQAKSILTRVGLSHRLSHSVSKLSRGECQRVAIARALIIKPKLILADEPTASLDPKTAHEIMDLLIECSNIEKASLIVVTHDPEMAKKCDQIYEMRQAKLCLHS